MKKITLIFATLLANITFINNSNSTDLFDYAVKARILQIEEERLRILDSQRDEENKRAFFDRVKIEEEKRRSEEAQLIATQNAKKLKTEEDRKQFVADILTGWAKASGGSVGQVGSIINNIINSDGDIEQLKNGFINGQLFGESLYAYGKVGVSLWGEMNPFVSFVKNDERSIYEYSELFCLLAVAGVTDASIIKRDYKTYLNGLGLSKFSDNDIFAAYPGFLVLNIMKAKGEVAVPLGELKKINLLEHNGSLSQAVESRAYKAKLAYKMLALQNAINSVLAQGLPVNADTLLSQLKSPS